MLLVVLDLPRRSHFCLTVALKLFLHGLNVVAMNISFSLSVVPSLFSFDFVHKSLGFLSLTIFNLPSRSRLG